MEFLEEDSSKNSLGKNYWVKGFETFNKVQCFAFAFKEDKLYFSELQLLGKRREDDVF